MIRLPRPLFTACAALAVALLAGCAAGPAPASMAASAPSVPGDVSDLVWEQDMQRFAEADAVLPPLAGAVLFIGSSSIRLWETLAQDFPDVAVVNRGFGGSEIRDSTWYAGRILVPLAPRQVVLYAGENDINSGRSPQQVRDDFRAFVERIRRDLPGVPVAFISLKPSPSRAHLLPAMREANDLIRADVAGMDNVEFIDVFTPMLDAGGNPRPELFVADRLHLNRAGYELWRGIVAPYLR